MRKTILTTAAIAFVAVGMAFGVLKSEEIKNFFASKELYTNTAQTQEQVASADTTAATPTETDAALNDETPAAGEAKAEEKTAAAAVEEKKDEAVAPAVTEEAKEETKTEATSASASDAKPYEVNVPAALKDREMGSKDAPVVVEDYSSLTCPHCAYFHKEIFPRIKEKYIDTGKVRWIFRGFPLNEPALRAEMVARCAPEDQYEKLIDLMFKNQDRWAFTGDPMANLNMLLRLAGINDAMFQACTTNKDLEMGLASAAQTAGDKYQINSTPTFVFNDGAKKFSGAGTYEGFELDIEQTLKAATTPAMSTSNKLAPADEKPASENPLTQQK